MSTPKLVGKAFLIIVSVILFFTAVGFVSGHTQLFMREYFGVWEQNIETRIYKETEMYNEGKIQELAKAKLEYEQAKQEGNDQGAKAIASMIQHRFADYEVDRLPEGLAEFLTKIRGY